MFLKIYKLSTTVLLTLTDRKKGLCKMIIENVAMVALCSNVAMVALWAALSAH